MLRWPSGCFATYRFVDGSAGHSLYRYLAGSAAGVSDGGFAAHQGYGGGSIGRRQPFAGRIAGCLEIRFVGESADLCGRVY